MLLMAPKIQSVVIITKRKNNEAKMAAKRIANLLNKMQVKTYTVLPLKINGSKALAADEVNSDIDLIFAIGGDGTTLKAFRTISGNLPLLSINIGGHRGILSEVDTASVDQAIKAIVEGKYYLDSRMRIQASSDNKKFPPALNEVLITRAILTHTPNISINLMDYEINGRMDGLVVSTPTGSTGHSLSMGGPVLHESMYCLILSPVAPVNRLPQIVIPEAEIVVKVNQPSYVVIDGQATFKINQEQEIRISRFAQDAHFLRIDKKGMRQLIKLGY